MEVINVTSVAEMRESVLKATVDTDCLIMAAAISDFRAANPADHKIKKQGEELMLHLLRNPDVLAEVAELRHGPFTVGFAAETENLEAHAQEKLQNKKLDMIAANLVGKGKAFGQEENALIVFAKNERHELPQAQKGKLARQLIEIVAAKYNQY